MLTLCALAPSASAQDQAIDRAEMDLAAGRVLFQNSPLSAGIVEVRSAPAAEPVTPAPPRRREIRVVLPSPYRR